MLLKKFTSLVLVWAIFFQSALAGAAPVAKPIMSSEKYAKINQGLKEMVRDITKGRGWIKVSALRKNLPALVGAKQAKELDADFAKQDQNAIITFSVNGAELKFSSAFESGYMRISNNRHETFKFSNGTVIPLKDFVKAAKSGQLTYRGPSSLLEYASDLLVPRAEAIWGFLLGGLFGLAAGFVVYKAAVHNSWFGLGEQEEESTGTTTTIDPNTVPVGDDQDGETGGGTGAGG